MRDIKNEIRITGIIKRLDHPSVVRIISLLEDGYWGFNVANSDERATFIQMELCRGNLGSYVKGKYDRVDFLQPLEYLSILSDIVEGISFLHEANIIHRDIKPENCIVTQLKHLANLGLLNRSGRIVLCDFGYSEEYTPGKQKESSTCRGTEGYRAPELLAPFRKHDERVDIWSLGCLAYYLATAQHLFENSYMVLRLPRTIDGDILIPSVNDIDFAMERYKKSPEFLTFIDAFIASSVREDSANRSSALELQNRMRSAQSLLVPTNKSVMYLPKRTRHFCGREYELDEIQLTIVSSSLVAICGYHWGWKNRDCAGICMAPCARVQSGAVAVASFF
jgi:serine/threonine protein kinase